MTPIADIEAALRKHLPAELHGAAQPLAQLLVEVAAGDRSPPEAQTRLATSPSLASALHALAGREITAGSALISFGAGSQVGDVSIGDVAGGSIMKLSLSVGIIQHVSVSGQATVGDIIGQQIIHQHYVTPSPADRERALRALLHDHSGFIASRMEAFVGREAELAEIRARIAEKLPTGGYVTITGQAGQGKSSVIARLVADALGDLTTLRKRLLEPEAGVPICHFIPFSPGPDHQVGLLRNLIARLCLTYGLPDFYATSDSRPALRDYFAAALRDLAKQGHQEIIYLDGLDQIEEDASGVRDLSFLPEEPPEGIVFVLGTRPNDTLKPLELRKPQHEYWLPALSRADFDLILKHRKVTLDAALADRFYTAMQENALYLDLVTRELAQADASEPEQIIARVADNPANLFSLSIERLQRNERQWDIVLRPILGLLLATRAPLSQRALRALVSTDDLRTRQGLQRLGGLIQRDGEGRYGLFHLKLGDYLRQGVFATDEEESYHQRLVIWCEGDKGRLDVIWTDVSGDALEQERRTYARQHYITHLAATRAYAQLWSIVDTSEYGRAKHRYDPSTRSYALDLDIARQAIIEVAAGDADMEARSLPRLWRYSLLRCSLASKADHYSPEQLLDLVAAGRSSEAINLAELMSDPARKALRLRAIGVVHVRQKAREGEHLLQRAYAIGLAMPDDEFGTRAQTLVILAITLTAAQHPLAPAAFVSARTAADVIPDKTRRSEALLTLAEALVSAQRWEEARAVADSIPDDARRSQALLTLAKALVSAQRWEEARAVADSITQRSDQARALSHLALALTSAQRWEEARAIIDGISDWSERETALHSLVNALVASRRWEDAYAIAATLRSSNARLKAFETLANALGAALRKAETNAAHTVVDYARHRDIHSAVAQALAAPAQWEESRAAASAVSFYADFLTDEGLADHISKLLAQAVAAASGLGSASSVTGSMQAPVPIAPRIVPYDAAVDFDGRRTEALFALADSLSPADRQDTNPLTETFADDSRASALAALASALASTAHPTSPEAFTIALSAADALVKADTRTTAIKTLAVAIAATGYWDDILAATNALSDSERRSSVLRALVETLAAAQPTPAQSTLARRLASDLAAMPHDERRWGALSTLATVFMSLECWDDAHATITLIPDARRRADGLRALAAKLAAIRHPATAATFAASIGAIPNDNQRTTILSALASELAAAGRWEDARTAVDAIHHEGQRALALSNLAAALALAGRWQDARATADVIALPEYRSQALRALASALTSARRWKDARAAVDANPFAWHRSQGLRNLALALAFTRHWEEARITADAINHSDHRAVALSGLASALAAVKHPLAAPASTEAQAAVAATVYSNERDEVLITLTTALARARLWKDARATTNAIKDGVHRDKALSMLAVALISAKRWAEARAVIDAIASPNARAEPLQVLATALSAIEFWEEARATVSAMQYGVHRDAALSALAADLITAKHWEEARATINAIVDASEQAKALSMFTMALITAERWEEARTAADALPSSYRTRAMSSLGIALAKAQRWKQAHAIADAISDRKYRTEVLNTLALSLASAGQTIDYLALLYETWRHAQTRDELLNLFVISPELLRTYPELGQDFLDSFAWVDAQLTVG